jgi:hypothetical protein
VVESEPALVIRRRLLAIQGSRPARPQESRVAAGGVCLNNVPMLVNQVR